jgi:tetratricopeptide (TPR) repeat protein
MQVFPTAFQPMNIIDFDKKEPIKILEILGELIESAREQNDLDKLEKTIQLAYKFIDNPKFNQREIGLLNYFLGNAWSYIQKIKLPNEEFPLETIELEKQIIHLRIANNLIKETDDDFNKCQILTNLGNLFSHIGRFSEAQDYFNQCLEINNDFGMAIGNRGFGLYYYAGVIFEPVQQFIFMQYARKDLANAISSNQVYNDAKFTFADTIQHIESVYPINELNNFKNYSDFYKGLNKSEREYKEWCAEKKLFINPLNDILIESVAAHDCLFIPTMILKPNDKLFFHSMFNQLKQEYTTSRYLFYEAIQNSLPHFSDKDVVLMNTLDYSVYSFALEQIKITFRVCYSIFDKIAYFINIYFNLGLDKNRVSFRTVWYNNLDKNKGLNSQLLTTKNWAMRGLFWLSKDLYEKEFDMSIDPDAKEIASIRNFIEHKSFKIVESCNYGWTEKTETFEINRDLFYDKTFKLLKLSRSALMYLSFLINDEERLKLDKNPTTQTIPMTFLKIEDNEKL